MSPKLTLTDIADQRAYERERVDFRNQVIALKKRRRVHVGPVVTLLLENRDTIRFQIQEMARVEKLPTDEAIQCELDTYNSLIPEPGQLCATLFIELTEEVQMHDWLPKLVSIERSVALRAGTGTEARLLRAAPEKAHAANLTREETTASVHYIFWTLGPEDVAAIDAGPVALVIDHPAYPEETTLEAATVRELLFDLNGTSA